MTKFFKRFGVAGAALAFAGVSMAADTAPKAVTFAKDVAPIFQEKCQDCHHKGAMAPMSLVTYEETRPWAKSIKTRVALKQMPPWHIDKTVGVTHFANDRSLNDEQIATIVTWVDAGAPMGNPKDMPAAKKWPADNE
jgi:mono/diheme cytochrome c family protein